MSAGAFDVLLRKVVLYRSDTEIVVLFCGILTNASGDPDTDAMILNGEGVDVVSNLMVPHMSNKEVQSSLMGVSNVV